MNLLWRMADTKKPSEILNTFRIGFRQFNGSFDFFINTPWLSVDICRNCEDDDGHYPYLRDGVTFCWGRNKGWYQYLGPDQRRRSFYKHYCTRFSRLKLDPTFEYGGKEKRQELKNQLQYVNKSKSY